MIPGFFVQKSKSLERAEVIIVGGGLAGLTAAIHLARKGISTMLFERNRFPHHKVCGEYLSREVLPYLKELEIPFQDLKPADISRLLFSTSKGKAIETALPLGGFGLSRYALDQQLYFKALESGVHVVEASVTEVAFKDDQFEVLAEEEKYTSRFVLAAYGKRSNLDKVLDRPFFKTPAPWLAVKSHYQNPSFPEDLVALHNFEGGYCGLSRTETGAVNVCYLATYKSFKPHKNPEVFRQEVLQKNPFLGTFFKESAPLFDQPLTIAQVSFDSKLCVKDHILFLGDAAGLIHPLCGNGMAMAIHCAKIAAELILNQPKPSADQRREMEKEYTQSWNRNFSRRIKTGRLLQKILLNQKLSDISQLLVSKVPFVLPEIIKRTHGHALT